VFGPRPACLEDGQGLADRFAADPPGGEAPGLRDVGCQPERPYAGGLATGPRALMEQGAQRLAPVGVEDGMRRAMGGRRPPREGCQAPGVEGLEDIAASLVVAAEGGRDLSRLRPPRTGKQDLAAPQDDGIRRPYALLEGVLFGIGSRSAINGRSHAQPYRSFPHTLLAIALGHLAWVRWQSAWPINLKGPLPSTSRNPSESWPCSWS
jgi:hypothetical protein